MLINKEYKKISEDWKCSLKYDKMIKDENIMFTCLPCTKKTLMIITNFVI